MTTKNLHVIGIDPGTHTGWARITVPRVSIFGDASPEVVEWDCGLFQGSEPEQVINIARLARETQGLDYHTGPALVIEAWDIDPEFDNTDPEILSPVRIGAMLTLLRYQTDQCRDHAGWPVWLGDATITFQSRALAKQSVNDDRLKRRGFWTKGSDHIRDATRHALTALRRATENSEFAKELWPR
jgi:hypothetical protein